VIGASVAPTGFKRWIPIHETWRAFFGFVHILGIYTSTFRATKKAHLLYDDAI
jgi:uncharacterized membrane protein